MTRLPFLFTGTDNVMLCPLCGDENTHLDKVYVAGRAQEDGAVIQARVDSAANLTHEPVPIPDFGRRHVFSIAGWCENGGHRFAIEFQQHKGATLVAIRELGG